MQHNKIKYHNRQEANQLGILQAWPRTRTQDLRVQSSYHSDTLPPALSNNSKYFVSGCSSATCK